MARSCKLSLLRLPAIASEKLILGGAVVVVVPPVVVVVVVVAAVMRVVLPDTTARINKE
jgi:hypothetical protein